MSVKQKVEFPAELYVYQESDGEGGVDYYGKESPVECAEAGEKRAVGVYHLISIGEISLVPHYEEGSDIKI